jgi:hypothetical protein
MSVLKIQAFQMSRWCSAHVLAPCVWAGLITTGTWERGAEHGVSLRTAQCARRADRTSLDVWPCTSNTSFDAMTVDES